VASLILRSPEAIPLSSVEMTHLHRLLFVIPFALSACDRRERAEDATSVTRFLWPAPATAVIEATVERPGQSAQDELTLHVEPAGDELEVWASWKPDVSSKETGTTPWSKFQVPAYRVSRDGEFRGFSEWKLAASETGGGKPHDDSSIDREAINRELRRGWDRWVGRWIGRGLESKDESFVASDGSQVTVHFRGPSPDYPGGIVFSSQESLEGAEARRRVESVFGSVLAGAPEAVRSKPMSELIQSCHQDSEVLATLRAETLQPLRVYIKTTSRVISEGRPPLTFEESWDYRFEWK